MKHIYFLTPFPEIFDVIVSQSILGRANKKGLVSYYMKNLFDFSDPPHHKIDDYPFGGGVGMVLKPEPVFRAFDHIKAQLPKGSIPRVIFPTPDGEIFDHNLALELTKSEIIIFINGHYKGVDQRVRDHLITDEISIGDYVLTGGELPSLIILDAIVRLCPGVLNSIESAESDSFSHPLLDSPYYTRPQVYRGHSAPEVLLSGNHKEIESWKVRHRVEKTVSRRPDLWKKYKKIENGK